MWSVQMDVSSVILTPHISQHTASRPFFENLLQVLKLKLTLIVKGQCVNFSSDVARRSLRLPDSTLHKEEHR
jgi:hypothetical protein